MRYSRQIMMKEFGRPGQQKLKEARVLVIGCGGLGSAVITCLACAGVGQITVADYDCVSITNLNRQFIHGMSDLNRHKIRSAKEFIHELNPETEVIEFNGRITGENINGLIRDKQVVIDCVDNVATRLVVNQACVLGAVTLIEGAVDGFYGFVIGISGGSPCLSCLGYERTVLTTPVSALATTTAVVGAIQANEAMKYLIGAEAAAFGRMISYDGLHTGIDVIPVEISDTCTVHQALAGLT